jgi:hypothetical protein
MSAAVSPFKVQPLSSGIAGAREHFENEVRPGLIEHHMTGENPFRHPTLGWHWAEWLKPQIDRDPSLLDASRVGDLYALWLDAEKTTSITVPITDADVEAISDVVQQRAQIVDDLKGE